MIPCQGTGGSTVDPKLPINRANTVPFFSSSLPSLAPIATILFSLFDSFSHFPSPSLSASAQQIPIVCNSFIHTSLSHNTYKIVPPQQQPFLSHCVSAPAPPFLYYTRQTHKPHKRTHIQSKQQQVDNSTLPLCARSRVPVKQHEPLSRPDVGRSWPTPHLPDDPI